MRFVDLRSDTKTLPTPEMRDAIFSADLGDDCAGEDTSTDAALVANTDAW